MGRVQQLRQKSETAVTCDLSPSSPQRHDALVVILNHRDIFARNIGVLVDLIERSATVPMTTTASKVIFLL